jgi:8-oxo-dGTP pyrophosphatase MutT (NUDIX family)
LSGERLFEALRSALPQTSPPPQQDPTGFRPASVLVPLCTVRQQVEVIFVQRSESLGAHPGQIAFPGGGRDPGEGDLACALREAEEEVGLSPASVEVLGALTPCFTPTGFCILPFVGKVSACPTELVPDPGEVQRIFTVPLEALLALGCLREAKTPGGIRVDFFVTGEEVIWGATARMLRQVLEVGIGRPLVAKGPIPWDRVRF